MWRPLNPDSRKILANFYRQVRVSSVTGKDRFMKWCLVVATGDMDGGLNENAIRSQFVFTANPEDLLNRWEHSHSIERQNRISNIDTLSETVQIAIPLQRQYECHSNLIWFMFLLWLKIYWTNQF
jgi:hypothetical protein